MPTITTLVKVTTISPLNDCNLLMVTISDFTPSILHNTSRTSLQPWHPCLKSFSGFHCSRMSSILLRIANKTLMVSTPWPPSLYSHHRDHMPQPCCSCNASNGHIRITAFHHVSYLLLNYPSWLRVTVISPKGVSWCFQVLGWVPFLHSSQVSSHTTRMLQYYLP